MPAASAASTSFGTSIRLAAADIKLAHSVFALPFALLAAFLARPGDLPWPTFGVLLGLVAACMFFARTWAMLVNRLADAPYDAANPRTERRAIASGRLTRRHAGAITAGCALAFIAACSLFWLIASNPWPTFLSVPVLAWIAFYSFTKRFTLLCHVFLGGALAASPIAAAIAVDPSSLASTPAIFLLAGMVLFWVAGFDVIYALQDVDFDRSVGLKSIPAALGWKNAARLARLMHTIALACLIAAAGADVRLGLLFTIAVAAVLTLLVTEHVILARRGKAGLDMAFFTLNGLISVLLGLAGIADVLI